MTMVKNFFLKRFFYSDKVINNIVGLNISAKGGVQIG